MPHPLGFLAVLCMATFAVAQSEDSAKDLKRLEGTWAGTFIEAGGKPLTKKEKAVHIKLVVKADKYTVFIEAAREHGTYQIQRQEMNFSGQPEQHNIQPGTELGAITLDYRKR